VEAVQRVDEALDTRVEALVHLLLTVELINMLCCACPMAARLRAAPVKRADQSVHGVACRDYDSFVS